MLNRDQAAKLRVLAEKEGLGQKDEPLTYSSVIGERNPDLIKRGPDFATRGIIVVLSGLFALGVIAGITYLFEQNNAKYRKTVKSMNRERELLKNELTSISEKANKLERDLALNARKNQELSAQIENFDETNASLKDQLNQLSEERQGLLKEMTVTQKKVQDLEQAREKLQAQLEISRRGREESISLMQKAVSEFEEKIAQLNARLEQKTQETGSAAVKNLESFTPLIVLINAKDEFALINAGKDSGYKKGMRLEVLRGGSVVGELEIVEVRQNASACDIKTDAHNLKVGDEVGIK